MKKATNDISFPRMFLLWDYFELLNQIDSDISIEFALLFSKQIRDLFTRLQESESGDIKDNKGINQRSSRLLSIKQDIMAHIDDNSLTIIEVAERQSISPQYVRALFNSEQTTFAYYVNALRLDQVYNQLQNPLYDKSSISTLAYQTGFKNLSWFNRAFKKRFGITPTVVREVNRYSANKK